MRHLIAAALVGIWSPACSTGASDTSDSGAGAHAGAAGTGATGGAGTGGAAGVGGGGGAGGGAGGQGGLAGGGNAGEGGSSGSAGGGGGSGSGGTSGSGGMSGSGGSGGDGAGGAAGGGSGGTATGGSGGGSGGSGGGSSDPFTEADCITYCDHLDQACNVKMVSEQYRRREECLAVCQLKTPGYKDDTWGDTMGCRLNQAIAATAANTADRPALCAAAGPSGGGKCGTVCEGYCSVVFPSCAKSAALAEFSGKQHYADGAACMATCGTMLGIQDAAYQWETQYSGDTAQCRIAHGNNQADDNGNSSSSTYFHCHQALLDEPGVSDDLNVCK